MKPADWPDWKMMMNMHVSAPIAGAALGGKAEFRNAMAMMGTAVNIVTTGGEGGRTGFTASAVCSVTDEPPTLLVCLSRNASVYAAVTANGVLCVNTLGPGHQDLSRRFGGKTPAAERFSGEEWSVVATGAPVLSRAIAFFDCRIKLIVPVSTHDVLICEIDALGSRGGSGGLLYFNRRYHSVPAYAGLET